MTPSPANRSRPALEVLAIFLRLGLTSFGGPVAHLAYFRREFVERRGWLDDKTYGDLVALCQFLPGPASSQAGFSIGLLRAGWAGGVAAWCGFTLPSTLLLLAFAALAPRISGELGLGILHGLKLVAVAVVAQAVWEMARRLCADWQRATIALVAIAVLASTTTIYAQVTVIALGAVLGVLLCRTNQRTTGSTKAGMGSEGRESPHSNGPTASLAFRVSHVAGAIALVVFCVLLAGLPVLAEETASQAAHVLAGFYRAGALVFGGGHVVLPLLEQETVASGWVPASTFLAGYGAAQAVPGPLFTFSAFLGWAMLPEPNRWIGAGIATAGIFLPGLLLVVAALPHWQALRARPSMAAVLAGVNAAVVGLLASALYSPVWTGAVRSVADFAIAVFGFALLTRWKAPPLAVVVFCAVAGVIATMASASAPAFP